MKFRLITTVWGQRFADLFLRVTVRSLLGEGNIDAFADGREAVYSIFTTSETADQLRKSPLFQRLENSIPIDFVLFGAEEIDPAKPTSHWVGWRRGVELAKSRGEIAFFIIADMLYATHTLRRWVQRFEEGYRAVWTSTIQAVLETAICEVEARFSPASLAPISMSNPEVVDLSIRHLHPLMIGMFRDTPRASRHPEVVFAGIPGEGFGERALGSHPMCVDPGFFRLTGAFSPLDRFEAIAFEEATGVGLEPLLKAPDLYARVSALDDDRLSNMGSWVDYFCTPSDLIEGMRTYRFSREGCRNDEAFRRVSAALGFYTGQVRITGAIYRAVKEMRQAGCVLAARIVASAHYVGRLRRHWRMRGPTTVFVPNDGAIVAWGGDSLNALLRTGKEKELARAVLEHVLVGRSELAVGDEIRISSRKVTATTHRDLVIERSARILAGPIECDDCTMYVIDRVLLPRSVDRSPPVPAAFPSSWSAHPAQLRPAEAPAPEASPSDVEPSPPPVSTPEPFRALLRMAARLARQILRIGYRVLRRLPGAGPLVELMKRRIQELLQWVSSRHAESWGAGSAPAPAANAHPDVPPAPTPESIQRLLDLQRARTTLTVAEVLGFYRSKVGDVAPDLPALALVDSSIRDAGLSEGPVEERLRALLHDEPNLAEAWYELGDIRLANRDYAEAIACFDRCLTCTPAIPVPLGRTGCHVLAASAKAVALERSGSLEMAAEAYRRAATLGAQVGLVRVAHGRLLRCLGRTLEAAAEFDAGMGSDGTALVLPSMPHDFSELARRLGELFREPITAERALAPLDQAATRLS